MSRIFDYPIMAEIQKRWSPRAFKPIEIDPNELQSLFEAARYAPSCYNEQPWRFIVAATSQDREKFLKFLAPKNQEWAYTASALVVVISKKTFTFNQQANDWHQFDAGTAWGFLALEATHRGFETHGMAGFDKELVRQELHIPDDYTILTMLAIGTYGDPKNLPSDFQAIEKPGERKKREEIMLKPQAFL